MQAVSPPALLLFQDFLQETKYNFLHIVVCHMVAAIVRQAGQVASHIAKTACWAHPNPCKMRKYPFAAARSSCAYHASLTSIYTTLAVVPKAGKMLQISYS